MKKEAGPFQTGSRLSADEVEEEAEAEACWRLLILVRWEFCWPRANGESRVGCLASPAQGKEAEVGLLRSLVKRQKAVSCRPKRSRKPCTRARWRLCTSFPRHWSGPECISEWGAESDTMNMDPHR